METRIRTAISELNDYVRDNKETTKVIVDVDNIIAVGKADVEPTFTTHAVVDVDGDDIDNAT